MIKTKLLFPKLKTINFDEAIMHMGKKMNEKGYVKDTFIDAVIEREKYFSTGLNIGKYSISIPHTEQVHVSEPAISIATFENPVKIYSMVDPAEELQADVMILMAVKDPKEQVKMLSSLMAIFRDVDLLEKLTNSNNEEEMLENLNKTSLVE